ncbi:ATP-binding cassette domain-containing protein [Paenarthrobacter sp. NPDC089316]|uniref:ATP-binding cassette domain-containing protein n=1 Tax=unclassified Paenarthrobacter TaxID=2634190 RepID=UPI003417545D
MSNTPPRQPTHDNILEMRDIRVEFSSGRGRSKRQMVALNGVDLTVPRGTILGLVGESGSGKSTLARVLTALERSFTGTMVFDGAELPARRTKELRRRIQMVFQDPYSSLDPRMTVRQTLAELLGIHRVVERRDVNNRCRELMEQVQLPARALDSYPISMSGGQRQRVAIAKALALEPTLLVADEAVSALDVSVQAGIVNLMADLRDELGLSVLFIAHDLAVVRSLCENVAVMYHGNIVEAGPTERVFAEPREKYTKTLLNSIPRIKY